MWLLVLFIKDSVEAQEDILDLIESLSVTNLISLYVSHIPYSL